jgi:phosphopantetheine--protein transferase-like protein
MNIGLPLFSDLPSNWSVGNDLVHVPTFQQSLSDEFKKKVYTENELAYCALFADTLLRFASTWAAKEAVYKALKQQDTSSLPFNKIEILRAKVGGKPSVVVHKSLFSEYKISLSLSHDGDYAWAIALVQKP